MRDSRPQLLDALFADTASREKESLHHVRQRAITLLKLNQTVKSLLPVQLHPWCRVANFRQGVLVLETANASWMTRLRYENASLLAALRREILPSLSSIDIRINPALMVAGAQQLKSRTGTVENVSAKAPLRHLSQESAEQLRGLAARSPEKLRKALERLAALAEKNTGDTNHNREFTDDQLDH
ncbi:DUF721 domain-containing protein [Serratia microhaemolytica]|uniref:DUF721 domain-containing protein n=1 Tax=Serratia microhaemolytica TaxID=2675110 RepID=UPI000FDEE31A|nr:DciA family protein [Serratia microhaemolytica]